ncbi:MAG: MotA/TolQ/ExbB proton channel family protein [Planctomycetes bacterium]|nr:MotA/TolQ/ExbB proton channel family protein [Planctomycetota bacterium]
MMKIIEANAWGFPIIFSDLSVGRIVEANGWAFTIIFSGLSLASLTIVIWKIWLNHNAHTDLSEFVRRLQEELNQGGVKAAAKVCEEEPGVVAKIFNTLLQTGARGKVATRDAIKSIIELEILPDLNFLLPLMLIFCKLAPMFGLLGTVWGMILAFEKIAGNTRVNPQDLSRDIGMALFTTAEGLIIAIPLIFVYTMFRERVNRFELELQKAADAALNMQPQFVKHPRA